jgi:hypothetical protein
MNKYKESIVFKSLIITLVITLLVPSFVKLAHAFENHKHEICVTPQKTHFHKFDLDCEFYKFKTSPQIAITFEYSENLNVEKIALPIVSQYQFISDYQRLSFSLRGPPTV